MANQKPSITDNWRSTGPTKQDAETAQLAALRAYRPIRKVQEFLRKVDADWKPGQVAYIVISGSNSCGKTALQVNLMGALAWPAENEFFKSLNFVRTIRESHVKSGGKIRMRFASTSDHVRGAIVDKKLEPLGALTTNISQYWPEHLYTPEKNSKSWPSLYVCKGGALLDVMTFKQSRGQFEGTALLYMGADEPMPEALFIASCARMRFAAGGIFLVTMTELGEGRHIYDRLLGGEVQLPDNHKVHFLEVKDEDALIENGGFLTPLQLENMTLLMTPEEKEARMSGQFLHLGGRIWRFRNEHIISRHAVHIEPDWPRALILDPHSKRPWAMAWMAVDTLGRPIFYDEWPDWFASDNPGPGIPAQWGLHKDYHRIKRDKRGTEAYIELIRKREELHGFPTEYLIIDENYGLSQFRQALGAKSTIEVLSEAGFNVIPATKKTRITYPIACDRMELDRIEKEDGTVELKPRFLVSDQCHNLIHQLQNVSWKEDLDAGSGIDMSEKVEQTYADFGCSIPLYGFSARLPIPISPDKEEEQRDDDDKDFFDFPPRRDDGSKDGRPRDFGMPSNRTQDGIRL